MHIDQLKKNIAQIEQVKQYGENLGFDFGNSFKNINFSGKTVFYWLYASYKDKIESAIGFEDGDCPFEYFGEDKAAAKLRINELDEFDTLLFSTSAYGGDDNCPITKNFLQQPLYEKASTLFHEGLHNFHALNKIKIPYSLEEVLACQIGFTSSVQFITKYFPQTLRHSIKNQEEWLSICTFVNTYYDQLTQCYEEKSGQRKKILSEAKIEINKLSGRFQRNWEATLKLPMNNAFFLRYIDYTKHTLLVEKYFKDITIQDYLSDPEPHTENLIQLISE
ncbi:MAG: aminopeptidase [archaeon]